MSSIGVLFAVTVDEVAELEARAGSDELADFVSEEIEERDDPGQSFDLDKAWDALHRCLTDGTLDVGAGTFPLNAAVLGRGTLDAGEEYFVGLTRAADVPAVAAALAAVDETFLRHAYRTVLPADYAPEYGEDDLEYTVGSFEGLPGFWQAATASGRSVIFTVSQ